MYQWSCYRKCNVVGYKLSASNFFDILDFDPVLSEVHGTLCFNVESVNADETAVHLGEIHDNKHVCPYLACVG